MKIAITSTGNSLDSFVDSRFGRCAWFVVYDTDSKSFEFIPNPHKNMDDDAGPSSMKLISSRDVKKIVSGDFGFKIKPLLDKLKIQMIVIKEPDKKVGEIIQLLDH